MAAFPNVSVIDVTETIAVFSKIMARLSTIVNFFTLFSVVAGILIIVSSVFATRYTRIQEAVFYTILGARGRFVLAVFAVEGLLIGLASAVIALALAQATGWIVCTYALDMAYKPFIGISLLMAAGDHAHGRCRGPRGRGPDPAPQTGGVPAGAGGGVKRGKTVLSK